MPIAYGVPLAAAMYHPIGNQPLGGTTPHGVVIALLGPTMPMAYGVPLAAAMYHPIGNQPPLGGTTPHGVVSSLPDEDNI
jgi:hypothetical protein